MATSNEYTYPCIVGSVQTLRTSRLQEVLDFAPIDVVLIDEAHHVTPKNSYAKIIEQCQAANPSLIVIGCTATPYRSDKSSCLDVLTYTAFERSIPDMQQAGWLSPITWNPLKINLDVSSLGTSMLDGEKDFSSSDLEDQLLPQSRVIAEKTLPLLEKRPTVVFCASVKHAHAMARAYNELDITTRAATIWGDMPRAERERTLDLWKSGVIQIVCNVGVLTEGFDYQPLGNNPHGLSAMVIARPTMSPSLYLQMLGRGTRLKPSGSCYQDCLTIDIVGNANLLETKQVTLPRVMPDVADVEDLLDDVEKKKKDDKKGEGKKRKISLLLSDAMSVSWVSWGYDNTTQCYHTSLGPSVLPDGTRMEHYVIVLPVPDGSGLWKPFLLQKTQTKKEVKWNRQALVDTGKPLSQIMQHVNHTVAKIGRKQLLDKEATWRFLPASEKQIQMLGRDYVPGMTKGDASHVIDWRTIKNIVEKTIEQGKQQYATTV